MVVRLAYHYATGLEHLLTLWNYFLRSYIKDHMFVSPVLGDLTELTGRISCVFACIEREMLGRAWQEHDFRIEVFCVTKSA